MNISHDTAHRDLCSLGIPHLNISTSPGNILISLSPDTDTDIEKSTREGFLTDSNFESASLPLSESEFEGPKTAPGDEKAVSTSLRVVYARN